jgi:hypothetical protein
VTLRGPGTNTRAGGGATADTGHDAWGGARWDRERLLCACAVRRNRLLVETPRGSRGRPLTVIINNGTRRPSRVPALSRAGAAGRVAVAPGRVSPKGSQAGGLARQSERAVKSGPAWLLLLHAHRKLSYVSSSALPYPRDTGHAHRARIGYARGHTEQTAQRKVRLGAHKNVPEPFGNATPRGLTRTARSRATRPFILRRTTVLETGDCCTGGGRELGSQRGNTRDDVISSRRWSVAVWVVAVWVVRLAAVWAAAAWAAAARKAVVW